MLHRYHDNSQRPDTMNQQQQQSIASTSSSSSQQVVSTSSNAKLDGVLYHLYTRSAAVITLNRLENQTGQDSIPTEPIAAATATTQSSSESAGQAPVKSKWVSVQSQP